MAHDRMIAATYSGNMVNTSWLDGARTNSLAIASPLKCIALAQALLALVCSFAVAVHVAQRERQYGSKIAAATETLRRVHLLSISVLNS